MSSLVEDKGYWLKHVENYKASGLNKNRYCIKHDVTYHKFLYWFDKLTVKALQPQTARTNTSKTDQFIKVKLNSEHISTIDQSRATKPLCILELKQGHRLLVHNEAALEKLFLLLSK